LWSTHARHEAANHRGCEGAFASCHSGYTDALRDASWFLGAVVAEGRPYKVVSRSASELWAVVDA